MRYAPRYHLSAIALVLLAPALCLCVAPAGYANPVKDGTVSAAGETTNAYTVDTVEVSDVYAAPLPKPVAALVQSGDRLLCQGDREGAAQEYTRAALLLPRQPLLRLLVGVALANLPANAINANNNGNRNRARNQRGRSVFAGQGQQGQAELSAPRLAVAQFRQAIQLGEDDPLAHLLLEGALVDLGETTEAQSVYLDAVRRFRNPETGTIDMTRSLWRLQAVLMQFPNSPILHLLLGDTYQMAGDTTHAEAEYQRTVTLAPQWAKPRVNLGILRLAQRRFGEAINLFEQALMYDPANTQARLNKADAQLSAGNSRDAITTYNTLTGPRAAPRNPQVVALALNGVGRALLNEKQPEAALRSFNRARRIAPKDASAVAGVGDAQVQLGNYDAGATEYATALRLVKEGGLFAEQRKMYRFLIEAQLSAGKPGDALQTVGRAMADEQEGAPLWHRLAAQAHFARGRPDEGKTALRDALNDEVEGAQSSAYYPQETLNAIAAHDLLTDIQREYQAEADAQDGAQVRSITRKSGVIYAYSAPPPTPKSRTTAHTVLAHIARYENQTATELQHRLAAVRLRGSGTDYLLLAETYDYRSGDRAKALATYQHALRLGGLPPVALNRALRRTRELTASGGVKR